VRLLGVPQVLQLLLTALCPRLAVWVRNRLCAYRSVSALGLLMPLQLRQCGQEGPRTAIFQPDDTLTTTHLGLEGEPGGDDPILLLCRLGKLEARRTDVCECFLEHVLDATGIFHRLDVPGKRDQVAPVALGTEHLRRSGGILSAHRILELLQVRLCRLGRLVDVAIGHLLWRAHRPTSSAAVVTTAGVGIDCSSGWPVCSLKNIIFLNCRLLFNDYA